MTAKNLKERILDKTPEFYNPCHDKLCECDECERYQLINMAIDLTITSLLREIEGKAWKGTWIEDNTHLPKDFNHKDILIIKESDFSCP